MSIINFNECNFNNIYFSSIIKENNNSFLNIYYKDYDDNYNPFLISLPNLYCNENIFLKNNKKGNIYEIILCLMSENSKITNDLLIFFKKLEEKIINHIKEESLNIFNNKDKINYKSLIKYTEINNYLYKNGLLKIRLHNNTDSIILNNDNEKIDIKKMYELNPPFYIQTIIDFNLIWIKNNIFGLSMNCKKLKISYKNKPVIIFKTISNLDDSDSEDKFEINNFKN